jgi:regulator of sigma E protease
MEIGWNILWFVIGVSLLVTVHEFGHFWVARKLGFKVLRFSVGFGKALYKRVGKGPDHTEFVLAAVPLGGYVRMLDERDGEVAPEDRPRAFASKPPWQRILVMLAGPAANVLFAILVLWGIYWVNGISHVRAVVDRVTVGKPAYEAGLRNGDELRSIDGEPVLDRLDASLGLLDAVSDDGEAVMRVRGRNGGERTVTIAVTDPAQRHKLTEPNQLYVGLGFEYWRPPSPTVFEAVTPDGPAAKAGFRDGDEVVSMDGTPVRSPGEFVDYVNARAGQEIVITVRRDGAEISQRVTPVSSQDETGKAIGRLLVTLREIRPTAVPAQMQTTTHPGPLGALSYAIGKSWQMTVAQAKFFVRMITGDVSVKNVSGFVSIAAHAGESARAGFLSFLWLMVLLSLSLGFLNLLPIPILDGGQIMFQLAEWVKGRPLSERTYLVGQQAGLVALVLLMGLALFNDLTPFFSK